MVEKFSKYQFDRFLLQESQKAEKAGISGEAEEEGEGEILEGVGGQYQERENAHKRR